MTEKFQTIPLSKLLPDPKNVRKIVSDESVADLVASIEHKGVMQNLLVRPAKKKGHYHVSAGGRRLRAAQILAKAGKLDKDFPMPVREISEAEASDMSLTENVLRQEMHPMDQFEAFSTLAEDGVSIEDIAVRYGTTCTIVKKRLAISRVAPELRELYREEQMGLEALQAFTLTDDHQEQLRVWEELPKYQRRSYEIRQALAGEGVSANDKRIQFLGGLEAYEAEGGIVKRDLFDTRNDGYALDAELVNKLVMTKLETIASTIRSQGWKWVEVKIDCLWEELQEYDRCYPEPRPLSDDEEKQLANLTQEAEELHAFMEDSGESEENTKRLEELEKQIGELQEEFYSPDDIAKSGAIISLNHRGEPDYTYGLYVAEKSVSSDQNKAQKPLHTAKLMNDLTAQRTAALQLELCHNPKFALVTLVPRLLLAKGYSGWGNDRYSCLNLSITDTSVEPHLIDQSNSTLLQLNALKKTRWEPLPENPEALWGWCLARSVDELLEMLAACVSSGIDAISDGRPTTGFSAPVDQLATAVDLDMSTYFKPTAETYFKHMSKTAVETVITESCGAEGLAAVQGAKKKSERSATAEQLVAKIDWLPEPLRAANPDENTTGPIGAGDEANAQAAQ